MQLLKTSQKLAWVGPALLWFGPAFGIILILVCLRLFGMFAVPLLGSHPSEEEFGGRQRLWSHAPIYFESWCVFGLLSVLFMACHLGICFGIWPLTLGAAGCRRGTISIVRLHYTYFV